MDFKKRTFWLDKFNGVAKGGYYFRSFDLNVFMKKLEEEGHGKVVGLEFEDGNVNCIVESSVEEMKENVYNTKIENIKIKTKEGAES